MSYRFSARRGAWGRTRERKLFHRVLPIILCAVILTYIKLLKYMRFYCALRDAWVQDWGYTVLVRTSEIQCA